jgi:peptidyl-prolyl cis-trans isomerase B (cyclophilin B)
MTGPDPKRRKPLWARLWPAAPAVLWWAAVLCAAAPGCGIESREDRLARAESEARLEGSAEEWQHAQEFEWPAAPDGKRTVAVLHVKDRGDIRIALYPELAPASVQAFQSLAQEGFYDGTTFHRIIPDFMIQGGDPNTRDDDPRNDGLGGPDFKVPDEHSDAHHTRGTVSLANTGQPNSSRSQFFIVQRDQPHLDGKYNVFGRVVDGMDVVDRVSAVEVDQLGRWGPPNRPIQDVVVERITFEEMDDATLHASN